MNEILPGWAVDAFVTDPAIRLPAKTANAINVLDETPIDLFRHFQNQSGVSSTIAGNAALN